MTTHAARSPEGLDLDRLEPWFRRHVPGAGAPLIARVLTGGKSNLTYEVSDGAGSWIVRRPPLGHVLATAHDMSREHRVMSALSGSEVPVPRMIAHCEDTGLIGAPFYVMEKVDGVSYVRAAQLESLGPGRTRLISESFIDTLVALHRIDPRRIGIDDFGKPEGFLGRQVRRWEPQLAASRSRELPGVEELFHRLAGAVPKESEAGIVHGDYRLDNLLLAADDRILALIDWEMSTLGDPLTDLALTLVYGRLAGEGTAGLFVDANLAPGYLREAQIIERYADQSERDLSDFGFYLALASCKLATICEGIHYRYMQGKTVGEGFEQMGALVQPLIESGLHELRAQ